MSSSISSQVLRIRLCRRVDCWTFVTIQVQITPTRVRFSSPFEEEISFIFSTFRTRTGYVASHLRVAPPRTAKHVESQQFHKEVGERLRVVVEAQAEISGDDKLSTLTGRRFFYPFERFSFL